MSAATQDRRPPLWLLFTITATSIMANTLISASIPDILAAFDRPQSDAGLLVAVGPLPAILLAPVMGLAADRFGRRQVLVPCLILFGVGGSLGGLAPSFGLLLVARFIQGIGGSGMMGLTMTLIGDFWHGSERSRYVGYNSAVLTVCLAVFPPLGGLLTEIGNWRWAFIPYPLALATAALMQLRLGPGSPDRSVRVASQLRAAARAVRQPSLLWLVFTSFAVFMAIFGLFLTVFPLHLEEDFGLSSGGRGLMLVAPALTSTVASVLLGRFRSRVSGRALLGFGLVGLGVAYALVGLAPTIWLIVVASLLYGFAEGVSIPTLQDLVIEGTAVSNRGSVISANVAAIRAGQTAGPLTAGMLVGTLSPLTMFVGSGMFAAAGGLVWLRASQVASAAEPTAA